MAEAEFTTTTKLPLTRIWDFVAEMDNWARFVTGYQAHEKRSETESLWTLKGDVGVLSRKLVFKVDITEWSIGKRAVFRLKGVNEPMEGEGVFSLESEAGGEPLAAPAAQGGALGSLPCAMLSAEKAREQIKIIRQRVSAPVNMNYFCHTAVEAEPAREAGWKRLEALRLAQRRRVPPRRPPPRRPRRCGSRGVSCGVLPTFT